MALADLRALLDDPRETLRVEIKRWLDLSDKAVQANLARELIALANHGGGWLLLGFAEEDSGGGRPEPCPFDAALYSPDAVNNICKRYADPTFQCEVRRMASSAGNEHVVIEVPGGHGVPVRTKRGGPEGSKLRLDTYYVRRAGPESAPIATALEWDALLKRCISNQRDDLLDGFRAIVKAVGAEELHSSFRGQAEPPLRSWRREARARLDRLLSSQPASDAVQPYAEGTFSVAYRLLGLEDLPTLQELMRALRQAEGDETGWPPWVVLPGPNQAPRPIDDAIEFWERTPDGAHADFWRVTRDGRAFLLRGLQEDFWPGVQHGAFLDLTSPTWLVGECILHAARLSRCLGAHRVEFGVEWTGLRGRTLKALQGRRYVGRSPTSYQDVVSTAVEADAADLPDALPELVRPLLDPLYAVFDFFEVPPDFYAEELRMMRRLQ